MLLKIIRHPGGWLLAALLSLGPLAWFGWATGLPAALNPREAVATLDNQGDRAVLVDVREVGREPDPHIDGSVFLPLSAILAIESPDQLPAGLHGKTLLLICRSGITSARAARKLSSLGIRAFTISGGLEAWALLGSEAGDWPLISANPQAHDLVVQTGSALERAAAWATTAGLKPINLLLLLAVLALLSKSRAQDLRALLAGGVFLLTAEIISLLRFWPIPGPAVVLDYLQALALAAASGWFIYALILGLDLRILRYNAAASRCAMFGLCGSCVKFHPGTTCGLRQILKWLSPALMVLSLAPLFTPIVPQSYTTQITGFPLTQAHSVLIELVEKRYFPILGSLAFAAGFLMLYTELDRAVPKRTQHFLAAGLGVLVFTGVRLFFGSLFDQHVIWQNFWEETIILMVLAGTVSFLWHFRLRLFQNTPGRRSLLNSLR
jgi:rhodanese-related sulfurtransferase